MGRPRAAPASAASPARSASCDSSTTARPTQATPPSPLTRSPPCRRPSAARGHRVLEPSVPTERVPRPGRQSVVKPRDSLSDTEDACFRPRLARFGATSARYRLPLQRQGTAWHTKQKGPAFRPDHSSSLQSESSRWSRFIVNKHHLRRHHGYAVLVHAECAYRLHSPSSSSNSGSASLVCIYRASTDAFSVYVHVRRRSASSVAPRSPDESYPISYEAPLTSCIQKSTLSNGLGECTACIGVGSRHELKLRFSLSVILITLG